MTTWPLSVNEALTPDSTGAAGVLRASSDSRRSGGWARIRTGRGRRGGRDSRPNMRFLPLGRDKKGHTAGSRGGNGRTVEAVGVIRGDYTLPIAIASQKRTLK